MKKMTFLLLIILLVTSCKSKNVTMTYYGGMNYNNNFIIETSLREFFEEDTEMKHVSFKSIGVKNELIDIRNRITAYNHVIDFEDGNYTFAFVNDRDTLYADDRLVYWRYKKMCLALKLSEKSKKIILSNYHRNPNQY